MRVVLATDGSETARRAEGALAAFPAKSELDVTAITVVRVPQLPRTSIGPAARQAYAAAIAAWRQDERQQAETILRQTRASLVGRVRTVTTRIEEGHAAPAIIEAAEGWNADLVVLGSRGLGPAKEFLLGSVCQKVVRYAPCSVLVVRQGLETITRLLVAVDGSAYSNTSIELASGLGLTSCAEIHLCAVVETPVFLQDASAQTRTERAAALQAIFRAEMEVAERDLVETRKRLVAAGCAVTSTIRTGHPTKEVLALARDLNAHLVVLGAKGRTATKRFLLGSVAQKVVKYAPTAVLVVRP